MKKDQYVIACLECEADAATVLPAARHFAERLGKGIIVLSVAKEGVGDWIRQYGLPYAGLKGDWKTAIDGLPTAFGGVLAVTAVNREAPRSSITNPSTLLKAFKDCRIAYLAIPNAEFGTTDCLLTIDHRRESKEKLIWASYLVRFLGSRLTVATPQYKDEGLRQKLWVNMVALKKFYESLGVPYTVKGIEASTKSPDLTLLHSPLLSPGSSLIIAMTTDRRDLGDLLLGNAERHLLEQTTTPVMLLNPRDDLYVLCD